VFSVNNKEENEETSDVVMSATVQNLCC